METKSKDGFENRHVTFRCLVEQNGHTVTFGDGGGGIYQEAGWFGQRKNIILTWSEKDAVISVRGFGAPVTVQKFCSSIERHYGKPVELEFVNDTPRPVNELGWWDE